MIPQLRKAFITLLFLTLIVVSGLFVPQQTKAQRLYDQSNNTQENESWWGTFSRYGGAFLKSYAKTGGGIGGAIAGTGSTVLEGAKDVGGSVAKKALDATVTQVEIGVSNAIKGYLAYYGSVLITLLSWMLAAVGALLDFVINFSIYGMSTYVTESKVIQPAWKTIRDLANMLFIFALLYIAINTILQREGFYTKKLIAKLIIAALLINFSMLFTKVIIDVSNIVTVKFYSAIMVEGSISYEAKDDTATTIMKTITPSSGLAAAYMQKLGMVNVFTKATELDLSSFSADLVMGIIFIVIAIFVFFVIALLFVMRFIILILLLIFSPIMFISSILPSTKGYADKWWTALYAQCIFAPAFMVMNWLTLQLAGTVSHSSDALEIIVNYVIAMSFLIASVIVAKSSSSMAGSLITNMTGAIGSYTAGKAARGIGKLYDRGAAGAANSKVGAFVNRIPLLNVGLSATDKAIRGKIKMAEDAKYGGKKNLAAYEKEDKERLAVLNKTVLDAESAKKMAKNKQDLQDAVNMKSGTADEITARNAAIQKAVYAFNEKNINEIGPELLANEDVIRNLKTSHFEALIDDKNEKVDIMQKKALKDARKKHIDDAVAALDSATTDDEKAKARQTIETLIQQRSATEIADTKKENLIKLSEAGLLTKQIGDAIEKKNYTPQEVSEIKFAKQNKAFAAHMNPQTRNTATQEAAEKAFSELSPKDFAAMGSQFHSSPVIMNMAPVDHFKEMMKSEKVTETTRKAAMDARFNHFAELMSQNTSVARVKELKDLVGKLTADEHAHLISHNPKLYTNTNFVSAIKPKTLEKIDDHNGIIATQKKIIAETRLKPFNDALETVNNTNASSADRTAALDAVKDQLRNKLDNKAISKLSIDTLKQSCVLSNLNTQVLKEMKEDTAKAAELRNYITGLSDTQRNMMKITHLHEWLTQNNAGKEFGV